MFLYEPTKSSDTKRMTLIKLKSVQILSIKILLIDLVLTFEETFTFPRERAPQPRCEKVREYPQNYPCINTLKSKIMKNKKIIEKYFQNPFITTF